MRNRIAIVFSLIVFFSISHDSHSQSIKKVTIVKNFDFYTDEIDSIKSYLTSMGIQNSDVVKDSLTYETLDGSDLLIWNDLSYQSGGIYNEIVDLIFQFYHSGRPVYFIGDDLAYSVINLDSIHASMWTSMLHLYGEANFNFTDSVTIVNHTHPVTNGFYGSAENFSYTLDIDGAMQTYTGEVVLARSGDYDAILAYNGLPAKVLTQNCLTYLGGVHESVEERKKIFQNGIQWLLNLSTEVNDNPPINEFNLSQNFPNPFNGQTNIRYSLMNRDHVTLKLFDALGREVATLEDGLKESGVHNFSFSIHQLTNHYPLSSGIYYYQLKSGAFSITKKFILLK
ncbi:MAG: T9SS type A sorting domain-containing protein [Ignavibacteria bacterium]|nr:T9SS type A sorting domain-containing protein [Ignavibacteria bacterium]